MSGSSDLAVLQDLFGDFEITIRKMFGGIGIYHQGVICAIRIADEIYLKVDAVNGPDFEAHGCPRFSYLNKNGRTVTMGYARVPDFLLDDPTEMAAWAQKAHAASLRK